MFHCYIDEAGDEGFKQKINGKGSSNWFIIGAIIVKAEDDLSVSRAVDRTKGKLSAVRVRKGNPPIPAHKALHWRDLEHKQKKLYLKELDPEPFTWCFVAFKKQELDTTHTLKGGDRLYAYATRYMLERVSWYARDNNRQIQPIFSNRSNTSYKDLQSYIQNILGDHRCQITPVIQPFKILQMEQSKMLQLADALVSATYNALEEDDYDSCETAYLEALVPKLYRRGKLFSYGVKIVPNSVSNEVWKQYQWLR